MSKFFCNGADAECSCPILCGDCKSADWTGGTEIKTIADHIRSMTDEELAEFSAYMMSRGDCWGCPWFWPCDYEEETCTKFFLDWLRKPYKEDT